MRSGSGGFQGSDGMRREASGPVSGSEGGGNECGR